jgi:hypothetical protein
VVVALIIKRVVVVRVDKVDKEVNPEDKPTKYRRLVGVSNNPRLTMHPTAFAHLLRSPGPFVYV